jgi:PAS domain S-box-containing protein
MINKEFLKTLKVLYVEDNDDISGSDKPVLTKIFKELIMCTNGQQGIDTFISYTVEQNKEIDIIISDINMPDMDGLQMVEAIRKINNKIPVILTTAHSESNFLLKAIELNISKYILKPINVANLINEVQDVCYARYRQKLLVKKDKELQAYIDIINNIATVQKTDETGNILYANKLFCKTSKYDKKEILKLNVMNIMHPDIIETTYKKIQEAIKDDKIWEGVCKFIDKKGELFYLHLFVVPQFYDNTDDTSGYVLIGFISTEDELKKQETMQKVRFSILDSKKKEIKLKNKIKTLEAIIDSKDTTENNTQLQDNLKQYRAKNFQLKKDIETYQHKISELQLSNEKQKVRERELLSDITKLQNRIKMDKENLIIANYKLQQK